MWTMNSLNHKTILKIILIYSVALIVISLSIAAYFAFRIYFPPQITDQINNPQLQNVNQAIELISGQTIDE